MIRTNSRAARRAYLPELLEMHGHTVLVVAEQLPACMGMSLQF